MMVTQTFLRLAEVFVNGRLSINPPLETVAHEARSLVEVPAEVPA